MKKDFTQPFVTKPATFFLLLQDESSGQFLIQRHLDEDKENNGYYAEDFYSLPTLSGNGEDYALELTKELFALGLSITTFQELVRATQLEYSFADDTPGAAADIVYSHVRVDVMGKLKSGLTSLSLKELRGRLEDDPLLSRALTQVSQATPKNNHK